MSASLTLSILATLSVSLLHATQPVHAGCEPRVIVKQSHTHFPTRSQLRGQKGTVLLTVSVDEKGRASTAAVQRSSGHRLLDNAATRSVLEKWQFDVSSCARKDLPISHVVAVEYRNPVYGS